MNAISPTKPATFQDAGELAGVKAGINAWITAVESRDNGMLPLVVTQADDSIWIGAGENEWLPGFDNLEQAMGAQNAALDEVHIDVSDETVHISPQADMAWATNQWMFRARVGEEEMAMPLRCTWILAKEAERWIIVHFHKSMGIPG